MIHDLDLVLWMVDARWRDVRAVGLPVLSDKVDIANARVEFANGAVANLTASRVSTEKVRKFRYFQPNEYFSIDFTRRDATLIRVIAAGQARASLSRNWPQPRRNPCARNWRPLWSRSGRVVRPWSVAAKENKLWH